MNRFAQFEDTNVYQQFASVLTIEPQLILDSEYDYYTDTLAFLRSTFCCTCIPTDEQIQTYISNNENIDTDKYDEFKVLINRIFEKYSTINQILGKMNIKRILKERIVAEREQRHLERAKIKEENMKLLMIEKERKSIERKKLEEEQKRLLREERERKLQLREEKYKIERLQIEEQRTLKRESKELAKKQQYDFNHAIITCQCGLEYIRYLKFNHVKSVEHRYRMDGITWYKNNTSFVFDTDSIMSDISSVDTDV
jgi:hypothetical protein